MGAKMTMKPMKRAVEIKEIAMQSASWEESFDVLPEVISDAVRTLRDAAIAFQNELSSANYDRLQAELARWEDIE